MNFGNRILIISRYHSEPKTYETCNCDISRERRGNVFTHKSEIQISNLLNRHKTHEGEHSNSTEVSPLVLKTREGQNTGKVPRDKQGGEFNCSISEEASSILIGRTKSKH